MTSRSIRLSFSGLLVLSLAAGVARAQSALTQPAQTRANAPTGAPAGAPLPPGYVIGADDVLLIIFWRDKEMSTEAVVRPDGKISLPLLNDVDAAGLTPEQLRTQLTETAGKLI